MERIGDLALLFAPKSIGLHPGKVVCMSQDKPLISIIQMGAWPPHRKRRVRTDSSVHLYCCHVSMYNRWKPFFRNHLYILHRSPLNGQQQRLENGDPLFSRKSVTSFRFIQNYLVLVNSPSTNLPNCTRRHTIIYKGEGYLCVCVCVL